MPIVKCDVTDCKYCVNDLCTKDMIDIGENPDYFGEGMHEITGLAFCNSIVDKDWDTLTEEQKDKYFDMKRESHKYGHKWMEEKYGKNVWDKLYVKKEDKPCFSNIMDKLVSVVYNEHYLYEEVPIVVGVNKRCGYVCRHCGKLGWSAERSWGYVQNMGGDTEMMMPCSCIRNKEDNV